MAEPVQLRLENVTAAELAPLEALFDPKYPEKLREVATCLYLGLKSAGPDLAPEQLALALTEAVSSELGGASFYMHKGLSYRLSLRDREIMAKYNGHNGHLLAREHKLTDMRIRQIVAAWQEEQFLKNQGVLPGVAAPQRRKRTTRQKN